MPSTLATVKSSNCKRMALLICHWYISGQFGTVHLISEPTLLTHQLLIDLDFDCPTNVPIITTSVTSTEVPPWNQAPRTEHILQLIFVDHFDGITDRLNDSAVFYQIYIVSVVDGRKEDLIRDLKQLHFENALLLLHNPTFDSNEIYVSENLDDPINATSHSVMENIFAETFGKLEAMSVLAIQYTHETTCHSEEQNRRFVFPIIQRFLANYYASQMNITFLEGISTVCEGGLKFNYVRHQSQSVYKELFFGVERLNVETIKKFQKNYHRVIRLVFDSFYHFYKNDSSHLSPLNSYDSTRIKVILFYGNDFRRIVSPPSLLDIISIGKHWFLFVWFALSTLALHLIRCTVTSRRIGIPSSTWSMFIVWIGGGNLQYKHKIEKFFLTMMYFAAFFVKAFGVGNFESNIVLQGSSGINTFHELAKLKERPIFLNHVFHDNKDTVLKLLGNVLGTNITTADFMYVQNVVRLPQSSLFVTVEYALSYAQLAAENQKDIDIIQGSLGEFGENFLLSSKSYISKRMTEKFNQLTSSMIENGLHQFYWKFTKFLLRIRGIKEELNANIVGREFCNISLDNFYFPLVVYVSLMTLAALVFAVETIYGHIRHTKSRQKIVKPCKLENGTTFVYL